MQIVSPQEKAALEAKREELYKAQIDVQERIRKAAALGDLSENAEYHFAKEENRAIQRQLAELESKLRHVAVVSNEGVPDDMVYLGHSGAGFGALQCAIRDRDDPSIAGSAPVAPRRHGIIPAMAVDTGRTAVEARSAVPC